MIQRGGHGAYAFMTAAAPSLPTMLNTVRAHGLRVSTARRLVLEALLECG